jgi:subtilisin-like proprotein convertase family protein
MFKKLLWSEWSVLILLILIFMLPNNIAASESDQLVREWAIRINSNTSIKTVTQATGTTRLSPVAHIERTWLISFPETKLDQARKILEQNQDIEWFSPQIKKQKFPREIEYDLVYSDPIFPYQWHLENTGQNCGTTNVDLNVRNVWQNMNIVGNDVVIGIVDNGVQHTHPDLSRNYVALDSWDFVDNDDDPSPDLEQDNAHGTAIAGLAAARDNLICGVGVAYRAGIAGIRLTSRPVFDAKEAIALSYRYQSIDIYAYTWGPEDNGQVLDKPGPLTLQALALNTARGRNKLGNIYIAAAGNGNGRGDNINYDGFANSRFTIAVGSVDHNGKHSTYSEPGAALMVVAPGSGDGIFLSGTDLQGTPGESCGDCQNLIKGTSAAAAQVAGVVALMLDANPTLTWRDVQHVLIHSATKNDPDDTQWIQNAAGLSFNPKYGFGLVNAEETVKTAMTWEPVNPSSFIPFKKHVNQPITDNSPAGLTSTIHVNTSTDDTIEHVEVILNAAHEYRGQLEVTLTSPSGTKSVLAESHADAGENYESWTFMTVKNWGETIEGDWQLSIVDTQGGHTGTLISWELVIHINGDIGSLQPMARDDQQTTLINTPVKVNLLDNDFDPNHDDLTIIGITTPTSGQVVQNEDQTVTYIPDHNFLGSDQFQYTITDARGGEDTATVYISVVVINNPGFEDKPPNTFWIENTGLSDSIIMASPELAHSGKYLVHFKGGRAGNDVATCEQDIIMPETFQASLVFWIKILASDVYGIFNVVVDDEFYIFSIHQMQHKEYEDWRPVVVDLSGFADGNPHNIKFKATIQSGNGETVFLLDDISMSVDEQPPVASNDYVQTEKNQPIIIDVLANDYDPNFDTITIAQITSPQHGKAVVNFNYSITYTPDKMFVGEDTFTYTIIDQNGNTHSAQVFVRITDSHVFPILNVTPESAQLPSQGGTLNFQVHNTGQGNMEWSAECNQSWIRVISGQTGTNAGTIKLQYETNPNQTTRTAKLIVTAPDAKNSQMIIPIIQEKGHVPKPILHVEPTLFSISEHGGNLTVNVSNQGDGEMIWSAQTETSWLTIVSGQAGTNDGTIVINCQKNLGGERFGELIIACPESTPLTVLVQIQQTKCPPAVIDIKPRFVKVSGANGTVEFHVHNAGGGNMNWTATTDDSWLTIISGASGMNNGTIQVSYEKNLDNVRIGTIIVRSPHANNQTISAKIQQQQFFEVKEQKIVVGIETDRIGEHVSMTSNLIIAGASMNDSRGSNAGKAYIWRLINNQWQMEAEITASDVKPFDHFGCAVDISDNIAIIGASGDDKTQIQAGSAYVFRYINNVWTEEFKIVANDGALNDNFGQSVAVSADHVIIGANEDDDSGMNSGSAYIYAYDVNALQWKEQGKLTAADGEAFDNFACSVDIAGDYAIIGADRNDDLGSISGSAYIFKREMNQWYQQAKLIPEDVNAYDHFGYDVAISENFAVIGAYSDDTFDPKSGYAYVFENRNGTWQQITKLIPSDSAGEDAFGCSVSISGNHILVGAYGNEDHGRRSGAAYIFQKVQDNWTEITKISARNGKANDYFGYSVAISGQRALVGAYGDDEYGMQAGALYIFDFENNQQ